MPIDAHKIFMFPESYNRLREELHTHWPAIWKDVQWAMAFDANMFVEKMNGHTDRAYAVSAIMNDSQMKIDYICLKFLTYLRKKRGELNP